jgi:hypothetical protein
VSGPQYPLTAPSFSREKSRSRKLPPLQDRRASQPQLLAADAPASFQIRTVRRQSSLMCTGRQELELSMDDLDSPSQPSPVSRNPSRSLSPDPYRQNRCVPLDYNQWLLQKTKERSKPAPRLSVVIPSSPETCAEDSPSPSSSNCVSPNDSIRRTSSPSILTTACTIAKAIEPLLQRKRIRSAKFTQHPSSPPTSQSPLRPRASSAATHLAPAIA